VLLAGEGFKKMFCVGEGGIFKDFLFQGREGFFCILLPCDKVTD